MPPQAIFGLSAALVSPFAPDGSPDLVRLVRHAEWVLANGCDSVTLFGTTGEGFSIAMRDRAAMLDALTDTGIGAGRLNSGVTATTVADAAEQARLALDAGARGLLFAPPYYLKGLEEEGLYAWFSRAFEAIGGGLRGVILYHIPGQTAVPLSVDLIGRLRRAFPEAITGIKDFVGRLGDGGGFPRRARRPGRPRRRRAAAAGGDGARGAGVDLRPGERRTTAAATGHP